MTEIAVTQVIIEKKTKEKKPNSLWSDAWLRLKKNRASMVSFYFISFVCFIAVFADFISPYPFDQQFIDHVNEGPSATYWLGNDSLGRDLLSRIIYGARMSMAVGIFTSLISLMIGTLYGSISGWIGGRVDAMMMGFVDILYSIPTLVLMIMIKVIFDAVNIIQHPELKALTSILFALSMVGWVTLARVVRGQVLQVREMAYVEAARAMGARSPWIVWKHVIPNILGPMIVLLTYEIPMNILFESFLSFIGLGLQPPFSSWGVLANEGWKMLKTGPHLMIFPGIMLFLVLLAFNMFGDGLRDAFDPKMRK